MDSIDKMQSYSNFSNFIVGSVALGAVLVALNYFSPREHDLLLTRIAPIKRVVDVNNDRKVDYYYPDLENWAVQREDGKFDVLSMTINNGHGFLVSRDKNQVIHPFGRLYN